MSSISGYTNVLKTFGGDYKVGMTQKEAEEVFGSSNKFNQIDKDGNKILSLEEILTARIEYSEDNDGSTRFLGTGACASGIFSILSGAKGAAWCETALGLAGGIGLGVLGVALCIFGSQMLINGTHSETAEAKEMLEKYKNDAQAQKEDEKYKQLNQVA